MPLKLLQTLESHTDRVWTVAWNPSGTILASSGGDKRIRLWARQGEDLKWNLVSILDNSHDKTIRRLSWSPCGQYIASASFDSTICMWKFNQLDQTWSNIYNLEGHESEVKSVAWSSDGNYLATCGRDKIVWIWERALDQNQCEYEDEEDGAKHWDCSDIKNDHTKDVKHVVWHPKANILVSCSYDDTIKLFHKNGDDWKCYETLTSHSSTVWSADFSASGEFLATCSDDRTVRIWRNHAHDKLPEVEQNSWKCISTIQGYHGRTIYDVSWCKMTDVIVSASGDNSLAFYSLGSHNNEAQQIFNCIDKHGQSHDCDVNTVSWNPKIPGLLASGSDDRSIKLWQHTKSTDNQGMTSSPLTIAEEILRSLRKTSISDDDKGNIGGRDNGVDPTKTSLLTFEITDFSTLLNNVKSLQNLQNESKIQDDELRSIEKLFDLKVDKDDNSHPVELSGLILDEGDLYVKEFDTEIVYGETKYISKFVINGTKFTLMMPRRSTKFQVVAGELFLFEKTGDLYKILPSGKSSFLLGHLFTFSDVKFITGRAGTEIRYILSSDRDEKVRISNYPKTFNIERFCFGHKSLIKRLIVVDEDRFVSVDQEDQAILWNLLDLGQVGGNVTDMNAPLKPKMLSVVDGSSGVKRIKIY